MDYAIGIYWGRSTSIFFIRPGDFPVHCASFLLKRTLNEIQPDIVVSMYGKEVYFLPFIKDGSAKVLEAHGAQAYLDLLSKGLP